MPDTTPRPVRLLAVSGSLRAASSNGALVRAAARLTGPGVTMELYEGLGGLPHFNPDLDVEPPPASVADLRARLRAADGLLVSSPEYAHGVPGALKNALDWVVGSGEMMYMPVALVNASLVSTHAHASLAETLGVMMAALVEGASVRVPVAGRYTDPDALLADSDLASTLRSAVAELARAARASRESAAR